MSRHLPFQLFACVQPVRGARRNALVDLQRNNFHLVPDGLYEIVTTQHGKTIDEVKSAYDHQYDGMIGEYFDFMEREELIFYTSTPELFPRMDLRWEAPAQITNAIIDIDEGSAHDFNTIFVQIGELGCKSIQIRCFCARPLEFWERLMTAAGHSRVTSVEIVTAFHPDFNKRSLFDFCGKFPRVVIFTAHSAPDTKQVYGARSGVGHIYYTRQSLDSASHCGVVLSDYFTINLRLFSESQQYNSCLNRKISIDANGDIKNCPSMADSYGNIRNTLLKTALEQPGFQKYWRISKDRIDVCNACEFRHICTDCRAYLEDPGDIYSKPLKCGYNPYTCIWEDWSTNPLKQKAIDHYNLQNLHPELNMPEQYA